MIAGGVRPKAREVVIPYVPRPLQRVIHARLDAVRFAVLVCHRRFGKTVLCINHLIKRAMRCELADPRFAYLAPTYKQAKRAAWDYMKRYAGAVEDASVHESGLYVEFGNRARVQLLGADDPDSLRGIYLDGVVFDEYAQMRPRVWTEVVRPALSDRRGWAAFIGTPKGRNAFAELYENAQTTPGWFAMMFKASETGILDPAELKAARRDMSDEEYEQEFECSWTAALKGAYYGAYMAAADAEGRITRFAWDPTLPVNTGWDIGVGDDTAIWFVQEAPHETHWIDYYEHRGVGADHYAKVLHSKPYIYGRHYLPHDVQNRDWGNAAKKRIDVLRSLGIRATIVHQHDVDDGINALRMMLRRSWFEAEACAPGIEHLRQYRREWVEKKGVFRPEPRHDQASHGADAARTYAMGRKEDHRAAATDQPDTASSGYDPAHH